MKKLKLWPMAFAFLVFGILQGQAQFLKKLKDKINKTEEAVEDDANGDMADDTTHGIMTDILGIEKGEVAFEEAYHFRFTATMEVTDHSTKKKQQTRMQQSYGDHALYTILEENDVPVLYDLKNEVSLLIDKSSKTVQVASMALMEKWATAPKTSEDAQKIRSRKTGASKHINGYRCEEYIIEEDAITIKAWFAPEVDFVFQDYLRGFSKMFSGKRGTNPYGLLNDGYGYVMEMTAYENHKKKTEMKVIHITKEPIDIDLSDYTVQRIF